MKINIALALTSAIFLMAWITGFVSVIFRFMLIATPDSAMSNLLASGLLFLAVIELLSIVSFSGSVLFLLEARKILSLWYMAVPLCIFTCLMVIMNLLVYSSGKPFLVGPINTAETLWIAVLALLSPCSLLLFLSLDGHNSLTKVYAAVSSAVSIFSVFFLFFSLMEISRLASVETLMLLLALLSPCSLLLFLSLDGHNSLTKVYAAISSAVSIFSVFFLFFSLMEISRLASVETLMLLLAFYWTVLMPAIGVCFLSTATMYRENDDAEEEPSTSLSGDF